MPHSYPSFPPSLQKWALEQPMFCTASAPLRGHHINVSPKGVPGTTFAILDENHAAYLDLVGSGAETIAHIYENGRVTLMFCSFTANPRIMRLYCTGRVIEYGNPEFSPMIERMGLSFIPGTRAVVLLDIWKVFTSCGYAVPTLNDEAHQAHSIENAEQEIEKTGQLLSPPCKCFEDRHLLEQWLVNKVNKKALDAYMVKFNSRSLDGLLALRAARRLNGEWLWVGDAWAWTCKRFDYPEAILLGVFIGILLTVLSPIISITLLRSSVRLQIPLLKSTTLLHSVFWRLIFSLRMLVFKLCLLLRILALHLELLMRDVQMTMMPEDSLSSQIFQ